MQPLLSKNPGGERPSSLAVKSQSTKTAGGELSVRRLGSLIFITFLSVEFQRGAV